ncbi:BatD family protein [Hydrogenimonas sp.]
MSIPGKLLGWMLPVLSLIADVRTVVPENPVVAGEPVEMRIEAEGENVVFPDIRKIGTCEILAKEVQRFEKVGEKRDGVMWVGIYRFVPERKMTIPSFEVIVDGRKESTQPLTIDVKRVPDLWKKDLKLRLRISRTRAFVGEPVGVTVQWIQKRTVPVMNVDFVPLKKKHFWVERMAERTTRTEGEYRIVEERYLFFPQIEGNLTIGPAEVKVAMAQKMEDAFGNVVRRPRWFSIVSEPAILHVEALPPGIKLVGNFDLKTHVSPRRTDAGKPVTLDVVVEGEGNLEDFELPELHIEGVTVYAEEPQIEQHCPKGHCRGRWKKRYILVSDRSFTIPSIALRFFDPVKESIGESKSEEVNVEVVRGVSDVKRSENPKLERVRKDAKEMNWIYVTIGVTAFFLGMGVMYIAMRRQRGKGPRRGEKRVDMGDESQMLQRLMPHISVSKEAAQMAENLYASIFEGRAVKIDRKEFFRLLEELRKKR